MTREIQREFDKHPVTVRFAPMPKPETTVYNGPVINVHGDRTQIVWNNTVAPLGQTSEEIARRDLQPGRAQRGSARLDDREGYRCGAWHQDGGARQSRGLRELGPKRLAG
jgi:hypothetical protein